MKTLIVYASKHGTTEYIAKMLQQEITNTVDVVNLKKEKHVDLAPYDRIIVGGSIHAGMLQKKVRKFCEDNSVELLKKQIGLYQCCMHEKEAEAQFETNYPEILRKHSCSTKIMGGEFRFEQMNFIEKAMVKKIAGVEESQSRIHEEKINEMVRELEVM